MKKNILLFLLLATMLIGCSDQSTDSTHDSYQSADSTHDSDQSADLSNDSDQSADLTHDSVRSADSSKDNDQEIYSYFGIQGLEQSIENNRFKCKATMDRTEEIWFYEAEKKEDIDIEYLINVTKGKAELVLIKPDGSSETIVEQTSASKAEDYTCDVLHVERGENRIKIITSGITEFEFDITITEGSLRNLGYYY